MQLAPALAWDQRRWLCGAVSGGRDAVKSLCSPRAQTASLVG